MASLAIPAHFDGKHIVLDQSIDLPVNANLLITVVSPQLEDIDAEDVWIKAATSSDAFNFLADPREDIYNLLDGIPVRPTA